MSKDIDVQRDEGSGEARNNPFTPFYAQLLHQGNMLQVRPNIHLHNLQQLLGIY
jgi:hypothetical protein